MRSLREHLDAPALGNPPIDARGMGVLDSATEGCAGGSCGVLAHFFLEVNSTGVIVECSARVRGRAAAFAAASALCESARGRSVVDAARLGLTTMHPSFAELSADDAERALVAEDGFHHALGRWLLDRMRDAPEGTGLNRPLIDSSIPPIDRPIAIVGMSGGVDSAVALHRTLTRNGGAAVGATLRLWIDPSAPDPESACCSPDSVRRARVTCHAAGVPHLSIDLREAFAREVVVPFVSEYAAGATPNPCVRCNGRFRLDELVRLADVVGADKVVTGHYARVVERAGTHLIARGVDGSKDQSYMLAQVEPATVARLEFPLGADHKPAIRAEAADLGLEQAHTAESQEVCFLGGGDYRTFLARAGAMGTPGEIVLDDGSGDAARGTVVGSHDGVARFTPGQRKGIGVAAEHPLYVLDVNPDDGRVLVGHASNAALDRSDVLLGDVRWHDPAQPTNVHVQLRYRARTGGVAARVVALPDDAPEGAELQLRFDQPQRAPSPGQAAVLFDDHDVVVGIGRILRSAPMALARREG